MIPAILASVLLATSPGAVARLVLTTDDPTPALHSPEALSRAAAARVVAVRDVKAAVPVLREVFSSESDPVALREELRALVLLGDASDVDLALAAARKDTSLMLPLTGAVSRREDALELFEAKLHPAGVEMTPSFLKQALWQRPNRLALTGSRLLARGDARAWEQLLTLTRSAKIVMTPSEEVRTQSIWYLVHTFAPDPAKLDPILRDTLAAPREEPSLREAFGRELLQRMLGAERKSDARYTAWLQTNEADEVIGHQSALFEYFTDEEFLTRKSHCGIATSECRMPEKRGRSVGVQAVAPSPYMLPDVLPPGLTDAVLNDTRCTDAWLALGGATVDPMGRVKTAQVVQPVTLSRVCAPAVETLMKLSLVTPHTLVSSASTGGIILARAARETPCLDEDEPYEEPIFVSTSPHMTPPKKIKNVEPVFPESVRRSMPPGAYALVIAESVISRKGCVRSIQLLAQSPYGELNTSTIQSLVQWKFEPGRLDGKAVDVLFNLTVQYKLR